MDSLYLLNCKSYEQNKLVRRCCKLQKEEIYSKHKIHANSENTNRNVYKHYRSKDQ
jgi:hypothetical protein